jgi:hypothetical protein
VKHRQPNLPERQPAPNRVIGVIEMAAKPLVPD